MKSVKYNNGSLGQDLYTASSIDTLGRVLDAQYGAALYEATYASTGRRLLTSFGTQTQQGLRLYPVPSYDPIGRVRSQTETSDQVSIATTNYTYDALGRLANRRANRRYCTPFDQQFTYDALGNVLSLTSTTGTGTTAHERSPTRTVTAIESVTSRMAMIAIRLAMSRTNENSGMSSSSRRGPERAS